MAASSAFPVITLDEKDVPGARFVYESVEKHSNTQLIRWLECRGLPKTGDRSKLLQRIHACIAAGEGSSISVGVDGGKWYDAKLQSLKSDQVKPTSDVPLLPYNGWGKFPSRPADMPIHFNKGHIHHHIVESVQFICENRASVNDSDDDDDGDDDIEDLHTAKPLKKGLTFFKSGHVQKMQDCVKSGHYFMKAKVMASYRINVMYDVTVTLSQHSGFVRDASCTCIASAMGRCNHVTALLYALADYNQLSDVTDANVSCTSQPCTWNQGRKKNKQPKKVQDSLYSSKKRKVDILINYDPRAPSTVEDDVKNQNDSMLWSLGTSNQHDSMWMALLQYNYDDYTVTADRDIVLKEQTRNLLSNLEVGSTGGFPLELVKEQGTDDLHRERRIRITASKCKAVASFQSLSAIGNMLSAKLWSTQQVSTAAMAYGLRNEATARQAYQQTVSNVKCIETGLWVHSEHPELAVSPDGLVFDNTESTKYGIIEIKCPKVMEGHPISKFRDVLSEKQLKQFCLEQSATGKNMLKRSHSYYFQIQMQMGITGLKFCDFVVWSCKETHVERIRFDNDFWTPLQKKLVDFHHSYLCPELFEMRLPRELPPHKLVWQ